jgi:hypothetical protein
VQETLLKVARRWPRVRRMQHPTAAGEVTAADVNSRTPNRDGQAYSFADGRTGSGVSAVTLILDDGTRVTATVQNGWFVAWWPGGGELTKGG